MSKSNDSPEPGGTYNVLPSDYVSHLAIARRRDLNLWENHGWGVRSTGGDGDTLLWVAAYQLRSREEGPFIKPEFSALQSMIAHVEYTRAERRTMHDNEFIAIGWNGMADLRPVGELSVDVDLRRAVWEMRGMRFTAHPPDWSVRGRRRDIGYDLKLHADRPAFWLTDRRLSALERGDRWHLVNARASGTIKVGGRSVPLAGMGWHERHIHLNNYYDPIKLLRGPGVIFHNGYSRDLDFHLMGRPLLGIYRAKVAWSGEEIDFEGPRQVSVREIGSWVDPRSRISAPVEWRVACEGCGHSLELRVRAFARTFYLWNFLTGGVNLLYWWLAEADGWFRRPGKKAVAIRGMKHVVHQNQALFDYNQNAEMPR